MLIDNCKLKILLISPLPPPAGGIATWTKKYLEWTKKNKLQVNIVNTAVIGKRATQINSSRKLIDEIKRTQIILDEIKKRILQDKPDVIHLNSPCGKFGIIRDYLCAKFIKNKGIPLVIHYRCNIEDQVKGKVIQKFFFRKLAKLADLNLVLNTYSREFLKAESGKDSKLIVNFIDEEFILNKEKDISQNINKIVFIGHVQITKGIKEIISASSSFPAITFTLAGPVSSEIKMLKIPDNVILLGPTNLQSVRELLLDADIFLFPTYTEGFSNALLEAMAMGLPVITTGVGANADMIEDFGGILVRTKNVEDIINAILKLNDSSYRKDASLWNVKKVKENYIIDSVMLKLIGIYKSVALQDGKNSSKRDF